MIAARRIAGTRAEKLAQLDEAIQELSNIKLLECAGDRPNVRFLAVPRRSPWPSMTMAVTILVMLLLLVLLLGVLPAHAQGAGNPAQAPKTEPDKPAATAADDDIWSHGNPAGEPAPDADRNV